MREKFCSCSLILAQLVAFFFNFVLGFFMGLVFYILLLIGRLQNISELITISDALYWTFAWVPAFGFMTGSLRAVTAPTGYVSRTPWANVDLARVLKDDTGVLTNVIWMCCMAVVFPFVLYMLEAEIVTVPNILRHYYSTRALISRCFFGYCCSAPVVSSDESAPPTSSPLDSATDEDVEGTRMRHAVFNDFQVILVAAEAQRIKAHNGQPQDMIELSNLDRMYPAIGPTPAKHALRGFSVGIPVGEVRFGSDVWRAIVCCIDAYDRSLVCLVPTERARPRQLASSQATCSHLPVPPLSTSAASPATAGEWRLQLHHERFRCCHVGICLFPFTCREGFKVMGFCPQFDALWPDMTGRFVHDVRGVCAAALCHAPVSESTCMFTAESRACLRPSSTTLLREC